MVNIEEIWKDIPGFEGLYQASSTGQIKSLNRVAFNRKVYFNVHEKILKQIISIITQLIIMFLI